MYRHAGVVVHMVYKKGFGWMLRDMVANTDTMLSTIRKVLRERTRLPHEMIDAIDRQRFYLSAEDCLRHGLVDELVEA